MNSDLHDVKIYQINPQRDINNVQYYDLEDLKYTQGAVYEYPYDCVFDAKLKTNDPEEINTLITTFGHPLYRGRIFSVSDVLVVDDKAYYKNPDEFKRIDFDEHYAIYDKDRLLDVVYVEPGKEAYITRIEDRLDMLQKAVGGYIEMVYNDDGTAIICNSEGKLIGMKGNRHMGNDIIAGPFIVVGTNRDELCSLDPVEKKKYLNMFLKPEVINDVELRNALGFEISVHRSPSMSY